MIDNPSMTKSIILGFLAILVSFLSAILIPGEFIMYGYAVGALLGISSVVKFVEYALQNYTNSFSLLKHSSSLTPASEFAKSISGLSPEALELVRGFSVPHFRAFPGARGHKPDVFIGNTMVSYEFAERMLNNSDGVKLQPIRSYSDGSIERRQAQELTEYFQRLGWVTQAQGNNSALWVNGWSPWNAKVSLGMETNEMEEKDRK